MAIKVNTITVLDEFVINKVVRSIFDMPNEGLKLNLAQVAYFL
jgi:hypothetical protein